MGVEQFTGAYSVQHRDIIIFFLARVKRVRGFPLIEKSKTQLVHTIYFTNVQAQLEQANKQR